LAQRRCSTCRSPSAPVSTCSQSPIYPKGHHLFAAAGGRQALHHQPGAGKEMVEATPCSGPGETSALVRGDRHLRFGERDRHAGSCRSHPPPQPHNHPRAKGSEHPAVVIPVLTHTLRCAADLLYNGHSRYRSGRCLVRGRRRRRMLCRNVSGDGRGRSCRKAPPQSIVITADRCE